MPCRYVQDGDRADRSRLRARAVAGQRGVPLSQRVLHPDGQGAHAPVGEPQTLSPFAHAPTGEALLRRATCVRRGRPVVHRP